MDARPRRRIGGWLGVAPLALLASLGCDAARADPPALHLDTTAITEHDYGARVVAPHTGRVLLVSFWASWCLPCIEELPGLLKLKGKLAKHGVDVVFVNADGPKAPPEMRVGVLERRGIAMGHTFVAAVTDPRPLLALVDPTWNGEVPFHAIYGPDGTRRRTVAGARPLAELEQAVMEVLAAPAVAPRP